MIDVVLQLIIFFMYTTQFSQVVRSQLELPEEPGEAAAVDESGQLVIDLRADGQIVVAGEEITIDKMLLLVRGELAAAGGKGDAVRILLRSDRNTPTAHVNAIARALADVGIRGWRLGTERPRGSSPAGEGRGR